MFEDDNRHQTSVAVFQWTLKHLIDDSFVAVLSDVMRRCQPNFRQVDGLNEIDIGIRRQEINDDHKPREHLLGEGIENVTPFFMHRLRLDRFRSFRGLRFAFDDTLLPHF